jgi:hypothetical protein
MSAKTPPENTEPVQVLDNRTQTRFQLPNGLYAIQFGDSIYPDYASQGIAVCPVCGDQNRTNDDGNFICTQTPKPTSCDRI